MKALLVIDMQKGSFNPYSIRHNTLGTVDKINALATTFRRNNYPVIFIQHDGTKENCFLPNSQDWELLPELIKLPNDISVNKTANDSFYESALAEILSQKNISEIFITGCATDFCVDSTVKSALSKDYKVTIVADAHTTASRPFVDAPTLIKHYNWVWSEMSPTKHKLSVVRAGDTIL
jgi:nicotinamidase-related amidase